MKTERDITCFCVGLGVGITAAVLWAPRSGANTRKQIRDAASEGSSYLKQRAANAADAAAEIADRGAKTVHQYKENVTTRRNHDDPAARQQRT